MLIAHSVPASHVGASQVVASSVDRILSAFRLRRAPMCGCAHPTLVRAASDECRSRRTRRWLWASTCASSLIVRSMHQRGICTNLPPTSDPTFDANRPQGPLLRRQSKRGFAVECPSGQLLGASLTLEREGAFSCCFRPAQPLLPVLGEPVEVPTEAIPERQGATVWPVEWMGTRRPVEHRSIAAREYCGGTVGVLWGTVEWAPRRSVEHRSIPARLPREVRTSRRCTRCIASSSPVTTRA